MTAAPFRFSVQSFNAQSAQDWRQQVRTAEDLGYSAFHLADHYMGPGPALEAAAHPPQDVAAVPAMAMAAEATSRIKIGCRVFCTGYRPAAVLVKEAMTLDFLSDGRLELGLGAGWVDSEYEAMGLTFESPGKRISLLEETVALMKQAKEDDNVEIDDVIPLADGTDAADKIFGSVSGVSANSVPDRNTGQSFYRVTLSIPPAELAKLEQGEVIPGMPVEAFLQTGERTVLSYLLRPLTDHLTRAFRED